MGPFCAASARSCHRNTIPLTSCIKESPVQATTRRIVLSSLVLGSSTHQRTQRATTQAAAAMPGKLIDAHVHVWAAVDDARSGKFPYYVSAFVRGHGAGAISDGSRSAASRPQQQHQALGGWALLLCFLFAVTHTMHDPSVPTNTSLPPPAGSDAWQQHSHSRRATHARPR